MTFTKKEEEKENKDSYNDFEILDDVENFSSKEQQFSHQNLIMKCLIRCCETGSIEMVEGRKDISKDSKGNVSVKHIPDTRKQFIEAVKTAKNFLKCDFDDIANEKINNLLEKVKQNKDSWLEAEFDWWDSINWETQQKLILNKQGVIKGMHNQEHYFFNNSIIDEIEIWREILEELNELTKRLDFYEATSYTA